MGDKGQRIEYRREMRTAQLEVEIIGKRLEVDVGRIHFGVELAGEVAARGTEGKNAGTRIEMIQRLLFHRVDAEARTATIGGEQHLAALHAAHETGAALAFVQLAVARAQITLDAVIVQFVPP